MEYLSLFTYSRELKKLILDKNANLDEERRRLQDLLADDILEIEGTAQKGEEDTACFQTTGLQTYEELEATITRDSPKD